MRGFLLLLLAFAKVPSAGAQIVWQNDLQGNYTINIDVSEAGDVYTVGSLQYPNGEQRMLATRISSEGHTVWERELSDAPSFGTDIVVDADGNAYVAGYFKATGHGFQQDWLVAKIAADGTVAWTKTYDGTNAHEDIPFRVLLDDENNVYVGGRTIQTVEGTSDEHISVIKYDNTGNVVWERHHNATVKSYDRFATMAWDNEGNLLVYGISWQKQVWPNQFDAPRLLKYQADGTLLVDVLLPSQDATHRFYDAASDADGNLVVYESLDDRAGYPRFVRTVSPEGEVLSNIQIGADSTNWNFGQNQGVVAVDASGRTWMGHTIQTSPRNVWPFLYDRMVSVVDDEQFETVSRDRVIASTVGPREITADAEGYVYVADQIVASGNDSLRIEKFNAEGQLVWSMMLDKHYGSMTQTWITNSFNVSMHAIGDGKLIVSYSYMNDDNTQSVNVRKRIRTVLLQTGSSSGVAVEDPGEMPGGFALHGNFPNPFNPSTTIEFSLERPVDVRLSIVDVLGRERAVLVDGAMPGGLHQVTFDATGLPSGQYFYRLQADGRQRARAMSLHK